MKHTNKDPPILPRNPTPGGTPACILSHSESVISSTNFHKVNQWVIGHILLLFTSLEELLLLIIRGAGMVQWWEHSPSTNVAQVWFPDSTSYVGWVCCWFSSLLREVFLRLLRFSPLLKTNTSKFQFDLAQEIGQPLLTLSSLNKIDLILIWLISEPMLRSH